MNEDDETSRALGEAVDEACAPALDEAAAPHMPAIREIDTAHRPTADEIVERMRLNGLEDPDHLT